MRKLVKALIIVVCVVGILVALPFVALRVVILPSVRTELLEMVPDYMDAELEIADMDYTLFSTWPNVSVTIEGVVLKSKVVEPAEKLLTIDSLFVNINVKDFLHAGNIKITKVHVQKPQVFARTYAHANNWDIIELSEDTTEFTIPVYLDTLCIVDGSIHYQNDTANYQASLQALQLNGNLLYSPQEIKTAIALGVDSIVFNDAAKGNRYAIHGFSTHADVAMLGINLQLKAQVDAPQINISDSLLTIADKPLQLQLDVNTDTLLDKVDLNNLYFLFDKNEIKANGVAFKSDDMYYVDAHASVNSPQLDKVLALVPTQLLPPIVSTIRLSGGTEAEIHAKGYCGGYNTLPTLRAKLKLNDIKCSFTNRKEKIDHLHLVANAGYFPNNVDSSFVQIEDFLFQSGSSHLKVKAEGNFKDHQEYCDVQVDGRVNLKELYQLYPIIPQANVQGVIDANVDAQFFLKDLMEKNIYNIKTQTKVNGDGILLDLPLYDSRVFIDSLRASMHTNTAQTFGKRVVINDTSLVNARISFRDMNVRFMEVAKIDVNRLSFSFLADDLSGNRAPKLRFSASCGGFDGVVNDTLIMKARRAALSTSVMPNREHRFVPTGAIRLFVDSIMWATPKAGMALDSTLLTFDATPRFRKYKRIGENGFEKIPDSEQLVINLDSLYKLSQQVIFSDEVSDAYLKHFQNKGHFYLKSFRMRDPNFPLRTSLRNIDITFNDDTVHLDDMRVRIGRSSLRFNGELYNMRRYLLRGRTLQGNLHLQSKRLDLNQFLNAATKATKRRRVADSVRAQENASIENETDNWSDESTDMTVDSLNTSSLIKIPKNLDLRFVANVDSVFFGKMKLADFTGNVRVKDQVLSIANLSTSTQIGKAAMHVSYLCKQPKSANVSFAVNMDSVQVGKLIEYIPQLDTIMPMLRSFDGSVACEASAHAELDKTMSIKLPTINGGILLNGDNMVLMDGETFSTIAKKLMFSKKTKNLIDSISVEMLVNNNEIEVYPFMVSMDKYRLAVGGTQGIDDTFDYHVAILKPIRLGLDVYGKDFDNINYKLSSVKFKDGKTKIDRKGFLLREEDVDVRKLLHEQVLNKILEENK